MVGEIGLGLEFGVELFGGVLLVCVLVEVQF